MKSLKMLLAMVAVAFVLTACNKEEAAAPAPTANEAVPATEEAVPMTEETAPETEDAAPVAEDEAPMAGEASSAQ